MKTGFKNLDKVFNIEQPQLVLFTGNIMVDMLSGDIANNICIYQEDNFGVLEIVNTKKEYLIKRLFVNEANVNYNKWTFKNVYSDYELKIIGQKMVNLIETTNRLPTIIESEIFSNNQLEKFIYDYVNVYADRDEIRTIIVIDIGPFNFSHRTKMWHSFAEKMRTIKFVKKMQKYCKKYNLPIIIICTNEDVLNVISKYSDRILKCGSRENNGIAEIDIIENNKIIGSCNLKYNWELRRVEDC